LYFLLHKNRRDNVDYELIINTDGVCCGNPGEMGIGGVIIDAELSKIIYTMSRSKGIGTNNESEMLAIKDTLELLENFNFHKINILVQCSSHLAVEQLANESCFSDDKILQLRTNIIQYSKLKKYNIKFSWISHEKNKIACALAAKGAKMPVAYFQDGIMIEWNSNLCNCINEAEVEKVLPRVNINTMQQIQQLNKSERLCISNIFSLMSFGIDKYSRAKINELLNFIQIRFDDYTRDYLIRTLEELNCTYSKNVLRWVARGLNPNLAFIKATLEAEIKEDMIR
jgi:ribonuclease HI